MEKEAAVIRGRFIKIVFLQTTLCLAFHPNEREKVRSQDNLAEWLPLARHVRVLTILENLAPKRRYVPETKENQERSWAAGSLLGSQLQSCSLLEPSV